MAGVTVWLFLPPADMETQLVDGAQAGLQFLRRNLPRVRVELVSPAVFKPGGKPGLEPANGPLQPRGTTGSKLTALFLQTLDRLREPVKPAPGDTVVFLDDADCRFCEPNCSEGATQERFQVWRDALSASVEASLPGVRLSVLLAAPELEGWLLAGARQPKGLCRRMLDRNWPEDEAEHAVRAALKDLGDPERWGCRS